MAHARQFAKPRYNVQQQSRRERDACTPRRQPHWLAARGSYPAPTEGSCAPSRPLVCPSVRPSHVTRAARCAHRPEKSLRIIEKSMSAWRAGSHERMARWKPACGNKRVPWGEDRGKGSECRQWKPRRRWPRSTRAARARCRGGDGREPPEHLSRIGRGVGDACVPVLRHTAGHSSRGP